MKSRLVKLSNIYGEVLVDTYGGQVLSYIPTGGKEVLWASAAHFLDLARAKGEAMRGGIPVCEKFGADPDGVCPQHGYARLSVWQLVSVTDWEMVMVLHSDGSWPGFPFLADFRLVIRLDQSGLRLVLTTHNRGGVPFAVPQALHTYLFVSDVAKVDVGGLEGSKLNEKAIRGSLSGPVLGKSERIAGEVDVICCPVTRAVRVFDSAWDRTLMVQLMYAAEVVLWNPGSDKGKPELAGDAWRHFLCVEAARVAFPIVVAPQQIETFGTVIRVV